MKAKLKYVGSKPGDANKTYCDNSKLKRKINYIFQKNINSGVKEFVNWYFEYYNIKNLEN